MIEENIKSVTQRIARCCEKYGRLPEDVKLICVTKAASVNEIKEALNSGIVFSIGENRVQDAIAKHAIIGNKAEWHLIGHLQTNKAKVAVRLFDMIHSVDRLELARELDRHARAVGRVMEILIEINCAGEETKNGVPLSQAPDLIRAVAPLENLALRGLMTMPPWFDDPEEARPYFRALRELRDRIAAEALPRVEMRELSMGMTGDYTVAVEEGATIVRIGRGIFGERPAARH